MSDLIQFYDTCCRIGRSRAPVPPGNFKTASILAEKMEFHNITHAAVEHAVAMEFAPRLGHEELGKEISGFPQMKSALHFMPDVTSRVEKAYTDPEEILSTGAVLGRVDAKDFCQGLGDQACFAPVLEACQEISFPFVIDFRRQGDPSIFDFGICGRFPGIPFILEGMGGYPMHRTVWIMKEYENCYLSTVGRGEFNSLGLFDELGLISRIVFGSNWPQQSLGMAQGTVVFADTDDVNKRAVASGTFLKLTDAIGKKGGK